MAPYLDENLLIELREAYKTRNDLLRRFLEENEKKASDVSPPREVGQNDSAESEQLQRTVYVKLAVLSVTDISTKSQSFSGEVLVQLKWENDELEDLEESQWAAYCQSCWLPQVKLFNLIKQDVHRQHVFITDDATPNNQLMLVMRQKIRGTFRMQMILDDFPFDIQDLTVTVYSEDPKEVAVLTEDPFESSYIVVESATAPQEWVIHSAAEVEEVDFGGDSKTSMMTARWVVKRKHKYYLLNVMLSMLLLAMVSFCTLTINPERYQHHRIKAAVTCMCSAFTIRGLVRSSLPILSGLSHIDRYLFGQLVFIFVVLVANSANVAIHRAYGDSIRFRVELVEVPMLLLVQVCVHIYLWCDYVSKANADARVIAAKYLTYTQQVAIKAERCGPRHRLSTVNQTILDALTPAAIASE